MTAKSKGGAKENFSINVLVQPKTSGKIEFDDNIEEWRVTPGKRLYYQLPEMNYSGLTISLSYNKDS